MTDIEKRLDMMIEELHEMRNACYIMLQELKTLSKKPARLAEQDPEANRPYPKASSSSC